MHLQSSHLHLCLSVIFAMPLSMKCLFSPLNWTFSLWLLLQLFCQTFSHPLKSGRHSPLYLFHASNCSKQLSQSIWTSALSWFLLLVPSLFHSLTFQSDARSILLSPFFPSRFLSLCPPLSFTQSQLSVLITVSSAYARAHLDSYLTSSVRFCATEKVHRQSFNAF